METLLDTKIDTPLGAMRALTGEKGLVALEFLTPARQLLLEARLRRERGATRFLRGGGSEARAWLLAYFAGDFASLPGLALDAGGTAFERRVWEAMRAIAVGGTSSYAALAARIGAPRAARAVGNASRRNPISLIVPCHRVVGAGGALTGYGGGLQAKRWLLAHERGEGTTALSPRKTAAARAARASS